MTTFFYTINDYLLFAKENTSRYITEETKSIVQFLSNKFGGSVADVKQKDKKSRNHNSVNVSNESWSMLRDFKPTVIIEHKDGLEKLVSEIRGALNKISLKNYDTNSKLIIEKLHEIQNQSNTTDEIKKMATNIFEIASTNKFFSEIYANLYKALMTEFPDIFTSILDVCIQGFTELLKTIQYVDQTTNYDEFCKYNKENDKRKATSIFITNLVKVGVIPVSTILYLINELHDILNQYIKETNKLNEVEEITENIYLLLTNNHEILKESVQELKTKMHVLSQIKAKEYPSISSRAIFKFIDIIEKMNQL
jgi:hypothetical protein